VSHKEKGSGTFNSFYSSSGKTIKGIKSKEKGFCHLFLSFNQFFRIIFLLLPSSSRTSIIYARYWQMKSARIMRVLKMEQIDVFQIGY